MLNDNNLQGRRKTSSEREIWTCKPLPGCWTKVNSWSSREDGAVMLEGPKIHHTGAGQERNIKGLTFLHHASGMREKLYKSFVSLQLESTRGKLVNTYRLVVLTYFPQCQWKEPFAKINKSVCVCVRVCNLGFLQSWLPAKSAFCGLNMYILGPYQSCFMHLLF